MLGRQGTSERVEIIRLGVGRRPYIRRFFDSTLGYPGEGPTPDELKAITMNVTGYGSLVKALKGGVLGDFPIMCIQEHHLGEQQLSKMRSELAKWKYQSIATEAIAGPNTIGNSGWGGNSVG